MVPYRPRTHGPASQAQTIGQPTQPFLHLFRRLPAELQMMITDIAMDEAFAREFDPRAFDLRTVAQYPRSRPFPFDEGYRDHASHRSMSRVLSREWLWITLRVKACNRACNPNEDARHFDTWWRKLRTYMRTHFDEAPLDRLNRITNNTTPVIEITMGCCGHSIHGSSMGPATHRRDLTTTFAAGTLKNEMFTSLMCKINKMSYRCVFNTMNVLGPQLLGQATSFMVAIVVFVRDSDTIALLDPAFVPDIVPRNIAPMFRRLLCWPTEPINNFTGLPQQQSIRELGGRLNKVVSRILVLIQAYPLHFMLPWVLDLMLLYGRQFRLFAPRYDRNNLEHRLLASNMGTLPVFACAGLAQYLLAQENTRDLQRHYSMPNLFPHNDLKFEAGEYFWTLLMDSLTHSMSYQDQVRNLILQTDPRLDDPEFWCGTYQALAELSLAFARAALVVGDDDEVLMRYDDPGQDPDPIPDIRQNTYASTEWTVPQHEIWHTRIQSMQLHLARAYRAMRAVEELIPHISLDRQGLVTRWMSKYERLYGHINTAISVLAANQAELRARTEGRFIQEARRRAIGRYNLRNGTQIGEDDLRPMRQDQPLRDPNEYLLEPFLNEAYLQPEQLINFEFPTFAGPAMSDWPHYRATLRVRDDDEQFD